MLTGEYAYYFTKSDLRYCYTDNDPDNGTYKHDYLYDNQNYKATYLYEKLTTLRSYATESNLKNYSMIDSAEYFENEFGSIYYQYTGTILPDLVSYGYVESSSEDFSEKLKNAKSFAESQKQTFVTNTQSQWSSFSTKLNDLKTSYETLNSAVKSLKTKYNSDGSDKIYLHTEAELGKSEYYDYSWPNTNPPTQCCRMSKSSINKKNCEWVHEVEVDGNKRWFYRTTDDFNKGREWGDGLKRPYWEQDAGQYNDTDPVSDRLDYLEEIAGFAIYTKITVDASTKTIDFTTDTTKYVGSKSEVQALQADLDKLAGQYETVKNSLVAAGCDDYDDSGSNTTIEGCIDYLETYLQTHGYEQIISSSARIQKLNSYISLLDTYSSSYTTM